MEPPSTTPRVAEPASLARLWRKSDLVDAIVAFLPTKCLAVLPTLADSFRRDQWRMLGVMMRRQGGAAAGTRAILSTLQVLGRELAHYREDWQDKPDLIPQRWRGCKGGRGIPAEVDVEHKVGLSSNKTNPGLIIERTTPHNSVFIGVVNPDLGVPDRCCMQRFRVSLRYTGEDLCRNQIIAARLKPDSLIDCAQAITRAPVARAAISESYLHGSVTWRAMQQTSGYILAITSFLCM